MHVQSFRLEHSGKEKSPPVKLKMNIINSDAGDFSTPLRYARNDENKEHVI